MDVDALFTSLEDLEYGGNFVATGSVAARHLIEIDGFGILPLPVVPVLLEPLRAVAELAPYGRGPDTLVDPAVRRCHQIDGARVELGPDFDATLEAIVADACEELGVAGGAAAHLYKLLVYGPGDFFVPHRDTEKEPGMFATLVVTLPSVFRGGWIRVQHGDCEEEIDLEPSLDEMSWVAFYADCQHEVRPFGHGVRVALVFNLVNVGAPTRPADDAQIVARLAAQLRAWSDHGPRKLIFPLEHHYTEAELGWDALKGADYARAIALRAAAAASETVAHLALVSVEQQWSAEEIGYRSRRRRGGRYGSGFDTALGADDLPDDLELYGLLDESARDLVHWVDAEGRQRDMPPLSFDDTELWGSSIDEWVPDEVAYYEATGNAGATLTRSYRRAALVLWPARFADAILVEQGPGALVEALPDLEDSRVEVLLARLLERAPVGAEHANLLVPRLIERGLSGEARRVLTAGERWPDAMRPALSCYLGAVDPATAAEVLELVVQKVQAWQREPLVWLVYDASQRLGPSEPALARLLAQLQGWTQVSRGVVGALVEIAWRWRAVGLQAWLRDRLHAGGDALRDAAEETLRLDAAGRCPAPWRDAVVEALRAHTRATPSAPADGRRAQITGCRCEHCAALNRFLDDPDALEWTYAVRRELRSHLTHRARSERIDVDTRELKRGSPQKLVVTKNQRRHEQALQRYEANVAALAKLGG